MRIALSLWSIALVASGCVQDDLVGGPISCERCGASCGGAYDTTLVVPVGEHAWDQSGSSFVSSDPSIAVVTGDRLLAMDEGTVMVMGYGSDRAPASATRVRVTACEAPCIAAPRGPVLRGDLAPVRVLAPGDATLTAYDGAIVEPDLYRAPEVGTEDRLRLQSSEGDATSTVAVVDWAPVGEPLRRARAHEQWGRIHLHGARRLLRTNRSAAWPILDDAEEVAAHDGALYVEIGQRIARLEEDGRLSQTPGAFRSPTRSDLRSFGDRLFVVAPRFADGDVEVSGGALLELGADGWTVLAEELGGARGWRAVYEREGAIYLVGQESVHRVVGGVLETATSFETGISGAAVTSDGLLHLSVFHEVYRYDGAVLQPLDRSALPTDSSPSLGRPGPQLVLRGRVFMRNGDWTTFELVGDAYVARPLDPRVPETARSLKLGTDTRFYAIDAQEGEEWQLLRSAPGRLGEALPPVTAIDVSPIESPRWLGADERLAWSVAGSGGVLFSAVPADVARVGDDGTMRGLRAGQAEIRARSELDPSVEATQRVVFADPADWVSDIVILGETERVMAPGAADALEAQVILGDCAGERPDAPPPLRYRSSAPDIVTVDGDGTLRALAPGRAAIFVWARGVPAIFAVVRVEVPR